MVPVKSDHGKYRVERSSLNHGSEPGYLALKFFPRRNWMTPCRTPGRPVRSAMRSTVT
jgi:hypothetical protein